MILQNAKVYFFLFLGKFHHEHQYKTKVNEIIKTLTIKRIVLIN